MLGVFVCQTPLKLIGNETSVSPCMGVVMGDKYPGRLEHTMVRRCSFTGFKTRVESAYALSA